ncbi:hypothetical protein XAP412_690031 [Xanthomonas phaseoli pv. phaseoli]|uniref:Uncharacterized protein n=1 Tax=Xanthomonas campestris pv. phaseoli TaxID=317013 RepID=A0AB38E3R0_XANCH|nr:hypothetical protein XAP6984_730032 [Xanthomonas phaseoli pv. phaseoli]SON88871.1 hypothetical protein XAP412_690031 [Xanthomonas phaseoli pv. phaseoli]SON92065.1 hypothetical protein XAP7430_690031 [Xanthomonas phaseoli pv. phaseoli]SOO28943.1 hypothetical protein XAP6164_2940003 [Xanthomonas phaseoli pv. phaseoli]
MRCLGRACEDPRLRAPQTGDALAVALMMGGRHAAVPGALSHGWALPNRAHDCWAHRSACPA